MRWSQLLLALHILALYNPLNANYYPDNVGRDIYYNDDGDFNEQLYNEQLGEIVRELAKAPPQDGYKVQGFDYDDKNIKSFVDDINLIKDAENYVPKDTVNDNNENDRAEKTKIKNKEKETETASTAIKEQPALPQKKGQNEFVGFVEPKPDKQLKHVEVMEKRIANGRSRVYVSPMETTGNLLFVSVATLCLVAAAFGIAGGAYYFHKVRSQRIEDTFSNFSHYAPTGPGKEKKKKDGDEGLAYRAQLHHYQQTKQKIISGSEQDIGIPEPDDASEASDYDENNFSVYECPGLAPTGDIEVQNPNFTRP